ncbi:MAG: heterodisulfide reductase-related iron-sulfur binding cluster [Promethearchaeota archaeon]
MLFPGCVIVNRLPFIEVSIRKIFDHLRISFTENPKFSCCPDPNGIKNTNKLLYSLTAARNIALAEIENKAILTPCNGCFTTLKNVKSEIDTDHHFKRKINNYLEKIDIKVEGNTEVFHMVDFIYKFKRDAIRDNLIYPLTGLRVAVHYGCHFLRPSKKVQVDDPLEPKIFDDLIKDLGAESIDYNLKMDCCGGNLERAGNSSLSLEIVNAKLESMKEKDVDCIVVCCPQCYMQFDHIQQELKKSDFNYDIPVLYYSELLCIALGLDIRDIIKKYHRTQVDSLFEKIDHIQVKNKEIRKFFDLTFLLKCYSCGACDDDCLISKMTEFSPNALIGKILKGKIDQVISDPSIWMCLDCYLCHELCPMGIGLIEIFTILRNLAKERGFIPKGYEKEYNIFYEKGIVGMPSKAARSRVGLPSKKPDVGDLKELFNLIERENTKLEE